MSAEFLCTFLLTSLSLSSPSSKETEDRSRGKTEKVLVVPYDIRIPKIRIGTRQARELRGRRIVVRIDSWEPDSFYPNGHFVHSIGPAGEIETETAVIMIENNLQHPPFSRALLDGEGRGERGGVRLSGRKNRGSGEEAGS